MGDGALWSVTLFSVSFLSASAQDQDSRYRTRDATGPSAAYPRGPQCHSQLRSGIGI
ncbi:hypothetical protein EVAR_47395_1, partial [Eumeta japonica]